MTNRELLLREISSCFGLLPRETWGDDLEVGIEQLCHRHEISADELIVRAQGNAVMLRDLAGHLTVEESYFLRDSAQFAALAEHVERALPHLQPDQQLTILSAGCARGEEPYSVAITLRERFGRSVQRRTRIIASDLNGMAIAAARRGVYSPWSFRDVPERIISRYFIQADGDSFRVCPEIRQAVTFKHLALPDHLRLLGPGSIDVALFRNVAIYLDQPTLQRIYEGFATVIKNSGRLILAPADARPPAGLFKQDRGNVCILVRTEQTAEPPVPAHPRPVAAPRPPILPAPAAGPTPAQARALAHQGRYEEALRVATRIIERGPSDKLGYLLRGEIALSARCYEQAVVDLRRALFLDPQALIGRYLYAQALRFNGRDRQALIQIRELKGMLEQAPEETVLEDGQTTAGSLLRTISFWS
jgi:chemotaxis protein methyltransferase CheR